MSKIDLCHFGEFCEPGIIINDILEINKKNLFMLGIYEFNNILTYLNDANYEKIYDKEFLIIPEPNSSITSVRHSLYNFRFNHDYKFRHSQIFNYDIVRNRFDIKIKNFREMLVDPKMCVFITFTINVDNLKINEMLEWLSLNKKTFHLIIFTNNDFSITYDSYKNLSIIKLKNSYQKWWVMNKMLKMNLYKEIYEKFINCLKECNIEHDFPLKY